MPELTYELNVGITGRTHYDYGGAPYQLFRYTN